MTRSIAQVAAVIALVVTPFGVVGETGRFGDVSYPASMGGVEFERDDAAWLNGRLGDSVIRCETVDEAVAAAWADLDADGKSGVRAIRTRAGVGFVCMAEGASALDAAAKAQRGLAASIRLIEPGDGDLAGQWLALEGFSSTTAADEAQREVVGGTVRGGVTVASVFDASADKAWVVYATTPATQGTIRRGPNGVVIARRCEDGLDWLKHEARAGTLGDGGARVIFGMDGRVIWVGFAARSIASDLGAAVKQRTRQRGEHAARIAAEDELRKLVSRGVEADEAVEDASGRTRALFAELAEIGRVSNPGPGAGGETNTFDGADGRKVVAFRIQKIAGRVGREAQALLREAVALGDEARFDGQDLRVGDDAIARP